MAEPPELTILLLGDSGVGKSTFLSRLNKGGSGLSGKLPITLLRDGDQPFVFDVQYFSRPYRFKFHDTASPKAWSLLHPQVIVLCYDISSRLSLIHVQKFWIIETKTLFAEQNDIPILVLGLKRDLRSETDPNGIIYPQEAYCVAQEMRCDKYMECSAISGELVHEVFEDICRTAVMTTMAKGGLSEGGCGIM